MRKIFIEELIRLNKKKKNIYLVINDLGYNVVEPFRDSYPKQFFNAGVSEQNMMGMSAGIASEQCHTFVYSIANFSTFRCAEQIRNDIDYHNLPVTIVSVGSGLGYGNLGYSHHALQDYALMRSFPNMLIFSPGNNNELINSLNYIIKNPQPSYLRLDKDEILLADNEKKTLIRPGKLLKIIKGSPTNVVITTGKTQEIAKNMIRGKYKNYSLYSLPAWGMKTKKIFFDSVKKFRNIVTVEDHFLDGGFGSWVNEVLINYKNNILVKNKYISSKSIYDVGSKEYLLKKYGPK